MANMSKLQFCLMDIKLYWYQFEYVTLSTSSETKWLPKLIRQMSKGFVKLFCSSTFPCKKEITV